MESKFWTAEKQERCAGFGRFFAPRVQRLVIGRVKAGDDGLMGLNPPRGVTQTR
jgi:hypothetical protein